MSMHACLANGENIIRFDTILISLLDRVSVSDGRILLGSMRRGWSISKANIVMVE